MMEDRPLREFSERLAGAGRQIYVSGALALTEPGPAAAGIVVTDEHGRALAHRAHYLGSTNRTEATVRALLSAIRLAQASGLEAPIFKLDDAALVEALTEGRSLPSEVASLGPALREARDQLPGHRIDLVSSAANLARPVALAPLVDWLPDRTRRAEELEVRRLDSQTYEVASEGSPGQVYRVTLPASASQAPGCECADFQYRGIPCKHLLAVAREAGLLEQLFYRASGASAGTSRPERP